MIYKYKKYNSIFDYVNNNSKSQIDEEYSICSECNGINFETMEYTDKCFGCLFCVLDDNNMLKKFLSKWGANFIEEYAKQAFRGNVVHLPNAKNILKNPIKNLEDFTSVKETRTIQPWASGLLNHMCSKSNRIGMEIPVYNMKYERNGRLDICSITDNYLLTLETKVSLEEALKDERFIEQHEKYTLEIKKCISDYMYITLFGGKETDLLTSEHKECTGKIGGKSDRFYSMVRNFGIKFMSAKAIWLMCCKYICEGNKFSWDEFLVKIFEDPDCVGLISAGKVMKIKTGYEIVSV